MSTRTCAVKALAPPSWPRPRIGPASSGLHEMASDADITNEPSLKAHLALGYHETERLIHFAKTL